VRVFEMEMKIMNNRKTFVETFMKNISVNSHLRDLARKILFEENKATAH
jgi:hypothetical protein